MAKYSLRTGESTTDDTELIGILRKSEELWNMRSERDRQMAELKQQNVESKPTSGLPWAEQLQNLKEDFTKAVCDSHAIRS